MRSLKLVGALLMSALVLAGCGDGNGTPEPGPTTGTIGGRVTDASTDSPLDGASVSTDPATSTVQTDAQGNYTIPDADPGSYTVSAGLTGYTAGSTDATVVAGQTVTADIALSPISNFDGTWSGTTSQDSTISFTVENNALTQLRIGFDVPCGFGFVTFTSDPPLPITNNEFTFTGTSGPDLTVAVRGTFESNTSASGEADITVNAPGCTLEQATWTATRS